MIENYKCPICKHTFNSCPNIYHYDCKLISYCECKDLFFSYVCKNKSLSLNYPSKIDGLLLSFKNNTTIIRFGENKINLNFLIDSSIFNSIDNFNVFIENIRNYI